MPNTKKKTLLDSTIVILSYNSKKVTDICLTKVEAAIKESHKAFGNNIEVIVVDNNSHDGSPEMIKKKHPSVNLMALKENIGYSRGNNLAMKAAKTPYIFLMNSDTYINPDSIVKTMKHMELKKNECDVLVSKYGYPDGRLQHYGGFLPTPLRIILWSFGLESVPLLKSVMPRIYGFDPKFYEREGTMEWASPCFLLMKKKVFDLTQGFDESLFFHMIDAEWCKRIKDNNLKICFTPIVQVVHLGGASSKGIKNTLTKDNFKGVIHFCKKHYPQNLEIVTFFLRMGLRMRSVFYSLVGKTDVADTYKDIANDIATY